MNSQTFEIENGHGARLFGVARWPEAQEPLPAVILCHGFKGFMEWGFFPPLADLLVARGFATVSFNFSGSGMRPGDERVTDPDAFRLATFSGDLRDLMRMVEAVGNEIAPDVVDRDRLALVGHSRGGGAALLAASQPEVMPRLRALVTWSAVATFRRFQQYEEAWRERGSMPVVNGRTGQELEIGVEVLDDLVAHGDELDLLAAAGRRRAPWLIVHGSNDETVPFAEAESLAASAAGEHELLRIEGGDHTFGGKHPFTGPTPQLTTTLNATQTWLRRHL